MTNQVLIKRSQVAAKIPLTTDLLLGELAANTYDGKLFLKKNNGTESITEVGHTVISGDISGSGNGPITLTLPDINTDVGAFTKFIVNAKGQITSASNIISSDVTTALGFTPYNDTNPNSYIDSAGAPVQSVVGRTGAVTLAVADITGAAPLTSPILTGTPVVPTPVSGDSSTIIS